MKKQIFSYLSIASFLFAMSACTKRVETTLVERQAPQKVVIEQRTVPVVREHVVNKKRVVEEHTDEFGRPVQQHTETTTEEYTR